MTAKHALGVRLLVDVDICNRLLTSGIYLEWNSDNLVTLD